jgi:hypothetical protein
MMLSLRRAHTSGVALRLARAMSSTGDYATILAETRGDKGNVGYITLNRPKALNALK